MLDRLNDRPLLRTAGTVFLAGFLLHNVDHARRGLGEITEHVIWSGTIVAVLSAVVLTLVYTDHPAAPFAAATAGFAIAVGVSASHLLPEWSAFSDPLPGGSVDALTWVAVLAEVAGAALLGAAGLAVLRRPGAALGPRRVRGAG